MVEGNTEIPIKLLKQVGQEETIIKAVMIAKDPRSGVVPVQGWNITTS